MSVPVRLVFPEHLIREPVLARLVRRFDVEPNIRRASIDTDAGWIVCEFSGDPAVVEAAISWLEETGVRVDLLGDVLEG